MVELESDNEGLRDVRAASSSGSGSGDMGSGDMGGSTSSPTNVDVDQSSDLSGLEEWHIAAISFGALSFLFCSMLTLMVSSSITWLLILNYTHFRFYTSCVKEGAGHIPVKALFP